MLKIWSWHKPEHKLPLSAHGTDLEEGGGEEGGERVLGEEMAGRKEGLHRDREDNMGEKGRDGRGSMQPRLRAE